MTPSKIARYDIGKVDNVEYIHLEGEVVYRFPFLKYILSVMLLDDVSVES